MKAIYNTSRGEAADTLVMLDADKPTPGPGEVLVKIATSGLNPSDIKVRSGAQGPMIADRVQIHNDGAGTIEAVGEGVSEARIGQRVWLYAINRSADGMKQGVLGTASEYVTCPSEQAPDLPDNASFETGACLGVPAMTAHRAVMWAGDVSGKLVLITGGAGAVGQIAIQIAKAKGAQVIATVSTADKAKIAKDAGADTVINYKAENLAERLIEVAPDGIDHVAEVDLAAHVSIYPQIMASGGTIGAYATASNLTPEIPFYPLAFKNICVQPVFVYSMSDTAKQAAIADINEMLAAETLRPQLAKTFGFTEIAASHETIEAGGVVGNIVIRVGS